MIGCRFFVVVFLLYVVSHRRQVVDGHFLKLFNPKNLFKKSTSVLCRLRHQRVVLDRSNNPVSCASICPTGYQDKYSLRWGHYCKTLNLPKGCMDKYCSSCKPNYYWIHATRYKERCVARCPKGYTATSSRTCLKCQVRGCETCDNRWTCARCMNGLALQWRNVFQKNICVRRCYYRYERVTMNGVAACRYKLRPTIMTTASSTTSIDEIITTTIDTTNTTPEMKTEVNPTTQEKNEELKKATATTTRKTEIDEDIPEGCRDHTCATCQRGFFRFIQQTGGNTCLGKCPSGYTDLGTMCVPCSDRRCQTCKSSIGRCDKCFPGFSILYDSKNLTMECVRYCPKNHFKKEVQNVEMCLRIKDHANVPTGCHDHACRTCLDGYYRFIQQSGGNTCVNKCPSGYMELETMCVPCSDRRCHTCKTSIGKCDKCFPGFSMLYDSMNLTMECVRYCPQGYKKTSVNGIEMCIAKSAEECPVANCKTCLNDRLHKLHKGCERCRDGYILYRATFNDFCYSQCPPQHYTATKHGNVTYCAKCEVPFCKTCSDADACAECIEPLVIDTKSGKCKVCEAFYTYSFEEKKCVPADTNDDDPIW